MTMFKHIITLLVTLMSICNVLADNMPDFDFPKKVIKDSEVQLKKALDTDDGESVVDALIKYGIAKCSISDEYFDDVIKKIESVTAKEKRQDIKAILMLLESDIVKQHEDQDKADSLLNATLYLDQELKSHKIGEYGQIIKSDALGRRLCPTLYDFFMYRKNGIEHILSILEDGEMQGFRIKDLPATKENYETFTDYVQKYPNGIWTNDIRNIITNLETRRCNVSCTGITHSGDSLKLTVNTTNAPVVYVRIFKAPDNYKANTQYKNTGLKEVAIKKIEFNNTEKLFSDSRQVELEPLPYGVYFLDAFVDGNEKKEHTFSRWDVIKVSDLSCFTFRKNNESKFKWFVVDHKTGAPIEGARLVGDNNSYVTTQEGCAEIEIPKDNYISLVPTRGEDKYGDDFTSNRYWRNNDSDPVYEQTDIFTDLAIYRPGETLHYSVVCHSTSITKKLPVKNKKITVTLYDTNHHEVAKDTITTDIYGQAEGSFAIPTDLTNGSFSIRANNASRHISVSEYKTPTFYVDMSETPTCFERDKDVVIKGRCMTYSGLPLSNLEVKVSVESRFWFWYSNYDKKVNIEETVKTDKDGKFALTIKKDTLVSGFAHYAVNALTTDKAGESQEGNCSFFIGRMRGLNYNGSCTDFICDKPISLPISFSSSDPEDKVETLNYRLTDLKDTSKIVMKGSFNINDQKLDFTKITSGTYHIIIEIPDDKEALRIDKDITLYRTSDKTCPCESPLWLPESGRSVENHIAHIVLGNSKESYIYYYATARTEFVTSGWLHYQPGMHKLDVEIPRAVDQYVDVHFICVNGGKTYDRTVRIQDIDSQEKLTLACTSFRDKLIPGGNQTWTFTLRDCLGNPIGGRLMLELFSEALNNLANNRWNMSSNYMTKSFASHSIQRFGGSSYNDVLSGKNYPNTEYTLPYLYTYDRDFYKPFYGERPFYKTLRIRGTKKLNDGVMLMSSAPAMALESKSVDAVRANALQSYDQNNIEEEDIVATDANELANELNDITVRESETKVALWEPMLNVNNDGTAEVSFTVPLDNTTWRVQALAFTNEMLVSNLLSQTIIAQRPVMAKPSLPRFLRIGDSTTLMSNIQNATDKEITADVLLELFNPRSGVTFMQKALKVTIPASGTTAVGIQCEVPDSLEFIGYRVKASAFGSGDGEQQIIPILPAVTPVVETIPFYLNPTDGDTIIDISKFPSNAKLSLEYCNNPVWYCLAALPTIYEKDSHTASGLIHNLYAVTLSKNIKGEIVDMDSVDVIIKALAELQNPDGGISWFDYPERKSSECVTYEVLQLIGELNRIGFGIDNETLKDLTVDALNWYEKQILEDIDRIKKYSKKVDYTNLAQYLYLRTLYPTSEYPVSKQNKKVLDKTLKTTEKNWRNFSLASRAYVAMSLYRNDRIKTAKTIIESLRQFSMLDARRGMFWDNLQQFGYRWYSRTALTATMLEAFNEIDPRLEEIDQIRKWILLEKQTTDWGSSSMAAEATYALISTGTNWLNSKDREYSIKDIPNTNGTTSNNNFITVNHNKGIPAWGAIYAKYPSKITETKAYKLDEISVTKELVNDKTANDKKVSDNTANNITTNDTAKNNQSNILKAGDLKVGDKVQVRITITTDRDMQYVSIVDQRAACFEPADKFSGYRFSSDATYRQSIGYYNNIKDTENRIFIEFLPKGSHIITYDAYVTNAGTFCLGLTTVTCQYAPQYTAHTKGETITVIK